MVPIWTTARLTLKCDVFAWALRLPITFASPPPLDSKCLLFVNRYAHRRGSVRAPGALPTKTCVSSQPFSREPTETTAWPTSEAPAAESCAFTPAGEKYLNTGMRTPGCRYAFVSLSKARARDMSVFGPVTSSTMTTVADTRAHSVSRQTIASTPGRWCSTYWR